MSYLVADEIRDRRRRPSSIFCLGFPASVAAADGSIAEPHGRAGLQEARACVESPHSAHRYRSGCPGPPPPLNPMDEAVPRTADAGTTTAARYRNIRGADDVQDHLVHAMEQSHLLDKLQTEEYKEQRSRTWRRRDLKIEKALDLEKERAP
ncbi:uncharacterized protein [Triticum aestivum]|uniref:uncharacterized protein n=1 Tax=Triticum aestivum TaxID=4565 RepID=UPI001D02BF69|nr:uncharacterized protein LOC123134296 [Triticum aestivum]